MNNLTHSELRQFSGTERWHRHGLVRTVLYTDGVKHLADAGGAYWLLDKIATLQLVPEIKGQEFQAWKLTVGERNTAVLDCTDGNENRLHSEAIAFTDFPLDHVDVWVEGGVIMLPNER